MVHRKNSTGHRKKWHGKKGTVKKGTRKRAQVKKIGTKRFHCAKLYLFLVVFLLRKNYLMLSLVMSVRPSVRLSVRPSSVEISLERGCTITNRPIDLKFGLSIGGRVMHA